MPMVYQGGVTSVEMAERVLAEGFDLVGMARALIMVPLVTMHDNLARIQIS